MSNQIENIFKKHFSSIGNYLYPEQRKVIENVVDRKNTLCLMPTGRGKSLCYWILGKIIGGTTIVISPLTALMDEQSRKLNEHGINVCVLHSGLDSKQQYKELISIYNNSNKPDFLFCSPERIATDGFLEFTLKSISERIKLFVIDEIHCISQWGHDFRPFYKEIPNFIEGVFGEKKPIVLGLTATLNPKDKEEICNDFNISYDDIIKSKYLLRDNISLKVVKVKNENEKDKLFWEYLEQNKDEKILVYLDRRKGAKRTTEGLCKEAISKGFMADFFHSERSVEEKMRIIETYKSGGIKLLFATSAFGMGIDIPDIRLVIHYLLPESVEQYYQQIGRVGRDWKNSLAILYYSEKNLAVRRTHYIDKSFPIAEEIKKSFENITGSRIGKKTFTYFGEENVQSSYHYLIRNNAINCVCKAIQGIGVFEPVGNFKEFNELATISRSGTLITISKKLNIPEYKLMEKIYNWLATGKIKIENSPSKCLVIESMHEKIPEDKLRVILEDIESKKNYKHRVFEEFVNIINNYQNSSQFRQAIGEYLGIDKYESGKTHQTLSGDLVRSKSEVIIANILLERGIEFDYEKELSSPDGQTYKPDFTIIWKGKTFFWEHLGLLDDEEYLRNWEIKKNWYKTNFPGQLITSEESKYLSKNAEKIVNRHFKK